MTDQNRAKLVEEAADIFVRLREEPENKAIQAERDAFIARGEAERSAFAQVVKAWESSGRNRGSNKPVVVTAVLGLMLSAYLAVEPLRTFLLADFRSGYDTEEVILASGDRAVIDAQTALSDETEDDMRRVKLIEGSALFDVEKEGRSFVVSAGDVTIEVLGTTFEASKMKDTVSVAVEEGRVRIRAGGASWTLGAGDQLMWSQSTGGRVNQIDLEAVATWRDDRFIADGLTFAEVASVIDRRLPGSIVITSGALADARVLGTINLENPKLALEALVAAKGARVISAGPIAHIVMP